MFKRLILLPAALLTTVLVLAACSPSGKSGDKATVSTKADVVATINGKPIDNTELRGYLRRRAGGREPELSAQDRANLLDQLINIELLAQKAEQEGLDKSPDLIADLRIQKASLLANAIISQYLKNNPVTEAQLKAEYDRAVKSMGKSEYKARHILVPSEKEAKSIIAELNKGADFAKLAKAKSKDSSAAEGGELGWFPASRMVPEFSAALEKLKKGEYTHTPVKTQYGWHIIKLEDVRPVSPPGFVQVKRQLMNKMQSKAIEDYVNKLRSSAKINIELPTAADSKDNKPDANKSVPKENKPDSNKKG